MVCRVWFCGQHFNTDNVCSVCLMIRRPPRSTQSRSSAASDVYKRQAAEVIAARADARKPHMGLTSWAGVRPAREDIEVAKNYLSEQELKVLNNLVSAYFDFAELNAIEEREMRMADFVRELDRILSSAGRKLLEKAGTISHTQAETKAKLEYQKYKAKTLEQVEKELLLLPPPQFQLLNFQKECI